jgi:RNA polymerase sigma factor (sigma-70 family)
LSAWRIAARTESDGDNKSPAAGTQDPAFLMRFVKREKNLRHYGKTPPRTWYYLRTIVSSVARGPVMLEDELLKWKLRRGSIEAMSRVYEKYLDSMLTLAMGLLHDADEAQDVVQDVFVSFVRCMSDFHVRGSLRAYLATSVVNRVRDRMRRNRQRVAYVGSHRESRPEPDQPQELVIGSEEARRLSKAMTQLPEDQREVIALRLKGDIKFREIAKLQGVPIQTVQARYRYGLSRLRSILDGEVTT